jgi:hypothetical protein
MGMRAAHRCAGGLGPTNGSVSYGGWKIDDVQVTGDRIRN